MTIGFTGTRRGLTHHQTVTLLNLLSTLQLLGAHTLRHGDCVGADSEAHDLALSLGYRVCIHPPKESVYRAFKTGAAILYREKGYHERNRDIVDNSKLVIACPVSATSQTGGTWYTYRLAHSYRLTILVRPDGTVACDGAARYVS